MGNPNEEFDPFATTTGLADNLNVTIRDFRFGTDPGYTNRDTEEMTLTGICNFVTDDPDIGTGGTIGNQFITIGKGWEAIDGGKAVQREDGRPKGFNESTYLGALINKCMELDEAKMRARYEETKMTPMEAGFWEGLQVHMVQTKYEAFGSERTRLLPSEVIGWGASKPAKVAGAKKAAGVKKAAKKAAPKAEVDPLEAIRTAAIAIAKVCEDDGGATFIERCYDEIAGLDESAEGMALVDDVEGEESIWMVYGATEVEE